MLSGARIVVLNCHHPLVRSCLELCQTELSLAALLLAQAIAAEEQVSLGRTLKMAREAVNRLDKTVPRPQEEAP